MDSVDEASPARAGTILCDFPCLAIGSYMNSENPGLWPGEYPEPLLRYQIGFANRTCSFRF